MIKYIYKFLFEWKIQTIVENSRMHENDIIWSFVWNVVKAPQMSCDWFFCHYLLNKIPIQLKGFRALEKCMDRDPTSHPSQASSQWDLNKLKYWLAGLTVTGVNVMWKVRVKHTTVRANRKEWKFWQLLNDLHLHKLKPSNMRSDKSG